MADQVVKGKLKLKGSKSDVKKTLSTEKAAATVASGLVLAPTPPPRKTKAELAAEAKLRERQEERAEKAATKSHKDKVKEFNEYLEKMSEHNDIPRIGPG